MKNLKKIIMLFVGIVTVSLAFTSCNSNDDTSVSYEDQKICMTNMAGNYSGMMSFYNAKDPANRKSSYVKYDSIATTWNVKADSTFTINYPVQMLDSAIKISAGNNSDEALKMRSLKKAIREQLSVVPAVKGRYLIPSRDWITSSLYQFYIQPQTIKSTLNYGGETHTVYFVFSTDIGVFTWASAMKSFEFRTVLSAIYIDNTSNAMLEYTSGGYFSPIVTTCNVK